MGAANCATNRYSPYTQAQPTTPTQRCKGTQRKTTKKTQVIGVSLDISVNF
jgi:hypothetical protein